MKRDISKLITLSCLAIIAISISIVYLSKIVKKTIFIKNILKNIQYKLINIIPYLKNNNENIEKELGI